MDRIVYRDKNYQGRGWVIAEEYCSVTIAENLSETEAKYITECMNANPQELKKIPTRNPTHVEESYASKLKRINIFG